MTEQDLHQIETALHVRLPESYRALMLNPPFAPDSGLAEEFGFDNVKSIIQENTEFREHTDRKSKLQPPERYFVISSNLSDAYYAIDLEGDAALPVMEVSFRFEREVYSTCASLEEFIQTQLQYEREAAEHDAAEEAAKASASPWPKRLVLTGYIFGWVLYIVYKARHA